MATYDAFISYHRAKDKAVAAALQSVIQRLGKPWYRRPTLRTFRDDTSLEAAAHLSAATEKALGRSRFFILLASPEAAASNKVIKQIAYWLDHHSIDTLLIAVIDGELGWDGLVGEVHSSRTTCLPRSIDLRAYRDGANSRDMKFIDLVADFAAAIHGVPKEDLLVQELCQQRRALSLAWSTAVSLLVLVAAASWGLKGAVKAERDAIEQSQTAEQQRRVAEQDTVRAERNFGVANETIDTVMFDIADSLRNIEGMKLETVREVLDKVEAAVRNLASRTEDAPEVRRRQAAVFRLLGDTYLKFGDFQHATDYAQKTTEISRELANRNPENAQWQHDLAANLRYEGDVLEAQGDHKGARSTYREGLNIARRLASKDPQNMMWRRDVVASLNSIGDVLVAQGDVVGAVTVYREGLELARALVASIIESDGPDASAPSSEPRDTRWQRDVMSDLDRIGDVLQSQGDDENALAAYRAELDIARTRATKDPDNVQWKRSISVVLTKLGFMRGARSDQPGAVAYCREALAVARVLAAKDQSKTEWQTDVVASLHCLARADDQSRTRWSEALAILSQVKSQGRLPSAMQGWIGTIERDLAKLEQLDEVPPSKSKQMPGRGFGTKTKS